MDGTVRFDEVPNGKIFSWPDYEGTWLKCGAGAVGEHGTMIAVQPDAECIYPVEKERICDG